MRSHFPLNIQRIKNANIFVLLEVSSFLSFKINSIKVRGFKKNSKQASYSKTIFLSIRIKCHSLLQEKQMPRGQTTPLRNG